jgi:hypothetical protein
MKPHDKHVKLIKLTCHVPSEGDGDELYIKLNDEKIWPVDGKFHRLKGNETAPLDIRVDMPAPKNSPIQIELWDFDWVSASDLLGKFEFQAAGDGHFSTDLTYSVNNIARYTLDWEIRA